MQFGLLVVFQHLSEEARSVKVRSGLLSSVAGGRTRPNSTPRRSRIPVECYPAVPNGQAPAAVDCRKTAEKMPIDRDPASPDTWMAAMTAVILSQPAVILSAAKNLYCTRPDCTLARSASEGCATSLLACASGSCEHVAKTYHSQPRTV